MCVSIRSGLPLLVFTQSGVVLPKYHDVMGQQSCWLEICRNDGRKQQDWTKGYHNNNFAGTAKDVRSGLRNHAYLDLLTFSSLSASLQTFIPNSNALCVFGIRSGLLGTW